MKPAFSIPPIPHRLALLWLLVFLPFFNPPHAAAALSGTKTIGPTGDYASITAAIADIQAKTLGGPVVLELQPTYVSTVETFPLNFTALTTTATNTLTLRPQTGASGLSITGSINNAIINLNAASFVTIDGRPGGSTMTKQLTIANADSNSPAVQFAGGTSNSILRYLVIRSANTSNSSGTVVFNSGGANGSDDNLLDSCDIGDGATMPRTGVYSLGSTSTEAMNNSGNTISNCNFFNFSSSGVALSDGNTGWVITGNSFYQTASRVASFAGVTPIFIGGTSGGTSYVVITNNFIGGSAPQAGGAPWTTTGTSGSNDFRGIALTAGNTTASSIQGNTISNFVWTSSDSSTTAPGIWAGIYILSANANVGTTTGNIIGSGTGTGSISVTTSGNGGTLYGIVSLSTNTVTIANNTVGSITVNGTSTSIAASLVGIDVEGGTNTISGNTVGSTSTANSLNAATSTTAFGGQKVTGILNSSGSAAISGNLVANLNNNGVGNFSQVRGIVATIGLNSISGNTVRNFSTTSQSIFSAGSSSSVVGIAVSSSTAGQTIVGNLVHSLSNTAASAGVSIVGISCDIASSSSTPNFVAHNLVHSLSVSSTSTSSGLTGIQIGSGVMTVQNNMVRIGLNTAGASTGNMAKVNGLDSSSSDNGSKFYYNSVYIGGAAAGGTNATNAFLADQSGSREYRNNIFMNARTNSGGTGSHYAVNLGGGSITGLISDNNVFLANGTGGVFGYYIGNRTTLSAWRTTTGGDGASINSDPLYANPAGLATTFDLHLQKGSPAKGAGAPISGVTDDYDGDIRNGTAPTIGADEISTNALLSNLVLGSGSLSPSFATGILSYTAAVSNGTSTLTLAPATANGQAVVTVNGTGASTPVALNVGTNTINIIVTAQDGATTNTYTVTVTRRTVFQDWAAANNVSSGTLILGANGVANLLNFAFGVNPNTGSSGVLQYAGTFGGGGVISATGQPVARIEGTAIRALFVRRKDFISAGLTYTVQFCGDATSWQDSPSTPTVLADDGSNQIVSVPFPGGLSTTSFFRVRVTSP